jgi:X-linked retinitis pigmentosa GTPase regulator
MMPRLIENFDGVALQVAAGEYHTLILTVEGWVYAFGSNVSGQLGVVTPHSTSITPKLVEEISHIPMSYIAAGTFSASVSKDKGELYLWGTGTFGEFKTPHRVKKIKEKILKVSLG